MATKIKNSNLDNTIITGLTTTEDVATTDQAIIYDASTGSLRKITQQNLLGFPTITSVSPTSVNDGDGTGNHTFVITGKALTGGSAALVNTNGATVNFDTVTVNSDTQITGIIAKGSLPGSGEPYDVRVEGSNGLISTLANQININQAPTFNTSAGSLGGVPDGSRATASFDIEAFDPESAGNVSFELQSGSLPAGATTSTVNENGVSKFRIAGTFSAVGSNTTSNFVIRAFDAGSNTSSRAFSLQVLAPTSESFTSSGTFSVPSGLTSASVLVVAGGGSGAAGHSANNAGTGGGGAGGLIFMPGYPVTPGGTITVTVGCGGGPRSSQGFGNNGQDSAFGSPGDPGLGSGGVLTAKGGGAGTDGSNGGRAGGSSGGTGYCTGAAQAATQPTQPGNSGAYGFGNTGGSGGGREGSPFYGGGGGGGGAGAAGGNGVPGNYGSPYTGAQGGDGKAYTIGDGTTSVYYAGGGGGKGGGNSPGGSPGGQGGGTAGKEDANSCSGTANRGGGSGGVPAPRSSGSGGKGVVIVRY